MIVPMPEKDKKISAGRVVVTSFIVDVLDIVLSLVMTIISGSVVMLTQTLQGLADLTASALLLIGVKRSQREADIIHQFGYGQEIYFWALLSAFVSLVVTSGLSVYLGWQRFIAPQVVANLPLALLVLGITIVTNGYSTVLSARRLLASQSVLKLLRIFLDSPLVETKSTLVLDLMGTSAGVLGFLALLIYGLSGDFRFDGLGAMAIGVVLALLIFLLVSALRGHIAGKAAHGKLGEEITRIALTFPQVQKVTELKTLHLSPEKLLVNLDIHVRHDLTVEEIERLTSAIKAKIATFVPEATDIQIELSAHR